MFRGDRVEMTARQLYDRRASAQPFEGAQDAFEYGVVHRQVEVLAAPKPNNSTLSNGNLGLAGTSTTSPSSPVKKRRCIKRDKRPAKRQSTRPATP